MRTHGESGQSSVGFRIIFIRSDTQKLQCDRIMNNLLRSYLLRILFSKPLQGFLILRHAHAFVVEGRDLPVEFFLCPATANCLLLVKGTFQWIINRS